MPRGIVHTAEPSKTSLVQMHWAAVEAATAFGRLVQFPAIPAGWPGSLDGTCEASVVHRNHSDGIGAPVQG